MDTAAKRFSMMGFGNPCLKPLVPASIDAGARATLIDLYAGIALSDVVVVVVPTAFKKFYASVRGRVYGVGVRDKRYAATLRDKGYQVS